MHPLKFEWREGPHGVDSLKVVGEHGILTFTSNPPSAMDCAAHPFDRTAALHMVRSLVEELLARLGTGHDIARGAPAEGRPEAPEAVVASPAAG